MAEIGKGHVLTDGETLARVKRRECFPGSRRGQNNIRGAPRDRKT